MKINSFGVGVNKKEIEWLLKEKYQGKKTKCFYKDIKRLNAGEPLDYVIGFTEFLGCKIDLSKKPLIPRPETEFWVEKAIAEIKQMEDPTSLRSSGQNLRILDIFAGSGCIGIAVLKHIHCACPQSPGAIATGRRATVDFVEKNKRAVEQIRINLKISHIKPNRYKIIQSDVFGFVRDKYDFVFANPPYAPTTTRDEVEESVLKFEPHMALFGAKDGLFYVRKLLKQARQYLNPKGVIFMEFNSRQKKDIEKLIKKYNYKNYKFHKDQYDRWRWVMIE